MKKSMKKNPEGKRSAQRVDRGGSANAQVVDCRSANRHRYAPSLAYGTLGLRPILVPNNKKTK